MIAVTEIRVLKRNLAGEVTWEYIGQVLRRTDHSITLEALFNRADMPFQGEVLKQGDRFVETYYSDRWYDVFEIYDRDSQQRKGWYCNITRPAVIEEKTVSYVDLALDLWVSNDGRQTVLDEDEFRALDLAPPERTLALQALAELQHRFEKQRPP